jgi:hypothetical protein
MQLLRDPFPHGRTKSSPAVPKLTRSSRKNRGSFDAFDSGSLGDATLEMIPFVVFRVLQEIEPADACRKIHIQNGRNTPESATT